MAIIEASSLRRGVTVLTDDGPTKQIMSVSTEHTGQRVVTEIKFTDATKLLASPTSQIEVVKRA